MEFAKTRMQLKKNVIIFIGVIFVILFFDAMSKMNKKKQVLVKEEYNHNYSAPKNHLTDFKGQLKYGKIKVNKRNLDYQEVREVEEVSSKEVENQRNSKFDFRMSKSKEVIGKPERDYDILPPNSLFLGIDTVIPIILDQDIISDYLGTWRGVIARDVYDSTKMHIVIPKGSRVIGEVLRIQNINEAIQARMGLVVDKILLPNQKIIQFTKKVSALDKRGISGVKDEVDYHLMARLMGVTACATLGSGVHYNLTDNKASISIGDGVSNHLQELAGRFLDLSPTITLNAGLPLNIFIDENIVVKSWRFVYE